MKRWGSYCPQEPWREEDVLYKLFWTKQDTLWPNHPKPPPLVTFFLKRLICGCHMSDASIHIHGLCHIHGQTQMALPWESYRSPQHATLQPAPSRASWLISTDAHRRIETNACFELHWPYSIFSYTSSKWCFSIQTQYAGALAGTCFSLPLQTNNR